MTMQSPVSEEGFGIHACFTETTLLVDACWTVNWPFSCPNCLFFIKPDKLVTYCIQIVQRPLPTMGPPDSLYHDEV